MTFSQLRTRTCRAHRTLLAGLTASALAAWILAVGHTQDTKPIKLGLFFDFTGAAATLAEPAKLAIDMAIEEINAKGGILGRKIQTVIADTQTDPSIGVGEIKRLVLQ